MVLMSLLIGLVLMGTLSGCGNQQPAPVVLVGTPSIGEPKVGAPSSQQPGEEIGISIEIASTGGVTLNYIWSADGGEIVRGQGSPAITYRVPDEPGTYNVRVKVEWEGQSIEKVTSIKVKGEDAAPTPEPPTDTPELPADTPTSKPTNTPNPTNTPKPPTDTPTPAPTNTPKPTNTPRPTPTPTATIDADPTVYDNFNNPANDGKWNAGRWKYWSNPGNTAVNQQDGVLVLSRQSRENGGLTHPNFSIEDIGFVEAKIMLEDTIQASGGDVGIGLWSSNNWWLNCSVFGKQGNTSAWAGCSTGDSLDVSRGFQVSFNSWHILRFDTNPDTGQIDFSVDGQLIGNYAPPNVDAFKKGRFNVNLSVWSEDGGLVTGYIDDVRIGQMEQ